MNYIEYIEHIGTKLLSILHTVVGWMGRLLFLLINYIAGHGLTAKLGIEPNEVEDILNGKNKNKKTKG